MPDRLIKDLNNSVGVFGWIEIGPRAMNNTFRGLSIPLISEQESFSELIVQSWSRLGGFKFTTVF